MGHTSRIRIQFPSPLLCSLLPAGLTATQGDDQSPTPPDKFQIHAPVGLLYFLNLSGSGLLALMKYRRSWGSNS